jgi:LacI family transcriptional regulator
MGKLTTREIARLAGVSPTAVSFALNGKPGISDETREHILKLAEKTGYVPAVHAPAVRDAQRPKRIAVVYPESLRPIDQLFYMELNSCVMLASAGFDLFFTHLSMKDGKVKMPEIILSHGVDGVLVFGNIHSEVTRRLHAMNFPVVELDSSRHYPGQVSVSADYSTAAYTAVRHLLELGHKDIAYIGNNEMHDFYLQTFAGFQKAAMEAGLSLDMSRIQFGIRDEQTLHDAVDGLIHSSTLPTAFFCATDFYAVHTIERLHLAGLRVPEDVSVIGIDDTIISRFTVPALTTVRIDREALARRGFEVLSELLAGQPQQSIVIPSSDLVIRESTAPPAARC